MYWYSFDWVFFGLSLEILVWVATKNPKKNVTMQRCRNQNG